MYRAFLIRRFIFQAKEGVRVPEDPAAGHANPGHGSFGFPLIRSTLERSSRDDTAPAVEMAIHRCLSAVGEFC